MSDIFDVAAGDVTDVSQAAGDLVESTPEKPLNKPAKKKQYRKVSEFKGHPWADMINEAIDDLDPTPSTPAKKVKLGESYVATGATIFSVDGDVHPGWLALANTVAVALIVCMHIFAGGGATAAPSENQPRPSLTEDLL